MLGHWFPMVPQSVFHLGYGFLDECQDRLGNNFGRKTYDAWHEATEVTGVQEPTVASKRCSGVLGHGSSWIFKRHTFLTALFSEKTQL